MSIGLGVLFSLLAAFFKSGKSITTKIGAETVGEYTTSWAFRIVAGLLFGIALLLPQTQAYLPTNQTFWVALILNSIALSATTLLIAKAFKVSDISVISPLMAATPIMATLPAWLLLGEKPTLLAGVGIILVTIGTYVLQVQSAADSFFEPIRRIRSDPGAKYIAIMLVIVGFVPSIDKIGLTSSTPLIWVFSTHIGIAIITGVLMLNYESTWKAGIQENWRLLGLIGVFNGILWIAQIYAYQFTYVAYVQAIKRISILLSVIAGYYIFDEQYISNKLVGATIILLGVLAVVFGA